MPVRSDRVGISGEDGFIFRIGRKVATSSAVPKTAGITVEKLSEDSRKKQIGPVCSSPRYIQLAVRQLINSKIHQAIAEMRYIPTYPPGFRDKSDDPLREKTTASTARQ